MKVGDDTAASLGVSYTAQLNDLKEECFAIINNLALAANLARYSALPETRQEWLSLFGNILLRYICILIDELHQ